MVTYVWRGTSSPPRPRHDVAEQSLNMDLFEAETCGETGLGGADALWPDGGRAHYLKGGWLLSS
jgi:hypothetical protein